MDEEYPPRQPPPSVSANPAEQSQHPQTFRQMHRLLNEWVHTNQGFIIQQPGGELEYAATAAAVARQREEKKDEDEDEDEDESNADLGRLVMDNQTDFLLDRMDREHEADLQRINQRHREVRGLDPPVRGRLGQRRRIAAAVAAEGAGAGLEVEMPAGPNRHPGVGDTESNPGYHTYA
jgi:hypothetical protein